MNRQKNRKCFFEDGFAIVSCDMYYIISSYTTYKYIPPDIIEYADCSEIYFLKEPVPPNTGSFL